MNLSKAFVLLSLVGALLLPVQSRAQQTEAAADGANERAYCVRTLTRIAEPVLTALSENKLRERMPVADEKRRDYTHLEAFGRLLAGMAPWLELGPDPTPEGEQRARCIRLAVRALGNAVDPASPDFMTFDKKGQPLVDAAFLSHALLRAPKQLWGNLGEAERAHLVAALKQTRATKPPQTNWLLFSAMVEAALWQFTGECELGPIELAVNKHLEWYKGDGVYGDGPTLHWDYYNSYVIQPMLLDVLRLLREKKHPLGAQYPLILQRARRHAAVQERLISPEGTFPVMGRSSAYRFGAFQLLSQVALVHELPPGTPPQAVRAALTTVIRRMIEAPGTFDEAGWLRIGVAGYQPSIKEPYISTGSLYLCAVGLLHLGLPPDDPLWNGPDLPWTQKRIWSGADVPTDHALAE